MGLITESYGMQTQTDTFFPSKQIISLNSVWSLNQFDFILFLIRMWAADEFVVGKEGFWVALWVSKVFVITARRQRKNPLNDARQPISEFSWSNSLREWLTKEVRCHCCWTMYLEKSSLLYRGRQQFNEWCAHLVHVATCETFPQQSWKKTPHRFAQRRDAFYLWNSTWASTTKFN